MIAAVGSATPWPAMSGALPCTGSNIEGLVPVASPSQYRKTQPLAEVAVIVTTELLGYGPAGGAIVEVPPHAASRDSEYVGTKRAATCLFRSIVTLTVTFVLVASPAQPSNTQPAAGLAVSVTTVLLE